jgi:hypothetical protein
MTRLASAFLLILAVVAARAITLTPNAHDFGKSVVNGTVPRTFRISSAVNDSFRFSLTGQDPNDFLVEASPGYTCFDHNLGVQVAACDFDVTFRPKSVGLKTATVLVINKAGQWANATLRGEAIKAGCQPTLVHCNYHNMYIGTIQVVSVDTVGEPDHRVRYDEDINITVALNGVVTCSGLRLERETLGYKGVVENEMKGQGTIAGTGMLAIEFETDSLGKPTYVLTYACPTPKMNRTSTHLKSGKSETESVASLPADWNRAEKITDAQPATAVMMPLLKGNFAYYRFDPDNSAGGITKVMWELKVY